MDAACNPLIGVRPAIFCYHIKILVDVISKNAIHDRNARMDGQKWPVRKIHIGIESFRLTGPFPAIRPS
ncbi:hypothetical protein SXCC_02911 [Gluconacetobacter sp. SXCC-1]|nr:hypothetical protein SXCC_02911 [Gluconacetobacter sp. SXCC-1]